jgi:hypothetical protein
MRRLRAEGISEGSAFGLCERQNEDELTNVVQDRKDIRKVSSHLPLCKSTLTCLAEHSTSSMPCESAELTHSAVVKECVHITVRDSDSSGKQS